MLSTWAGANPCLTRPKADDALSPTFSKSNISGHASQTLAATPVPNNRNHIAECSFHLLLGNLNTALTANNNSSSPAVTSDTTPTQFVMPVCMDFLIKAPLRRCVHAPFSQMLSPSICLVAHVKCGISFALHMCQSKRTSPTEL
jgi:hypothetical protein